MKKLILIRHSDAETITSNSHDFERKLTDRGVKKAKMQANTLKERNIFPNLIISSKAIRALETSQIVSSILNPQCIIHQIAFLYEDYTTAEFFDLISAIDNSIETVILVGHNPTLSKMASRLDFGAKINFTPCSLGIFILDSNWDIAETGCGKMIEFIE